jgi:secondary thiamine-phosphate synthase enzyme
LSPDSSRTFRSFSTNSSPRTASTPTSWQDENGHSHLQATTLSPSITVPVEDGAPILGTWQQIFHLECDTKPRERTVVVTVRGD